MNTLDAALRSPLLVTIHGWKTSGHYMHHYNMHAESRGFPPIYNFEYGWILFATARNDGIIHRIMDFVKWYYDLTGQRVVMIGHSHGCKLSWEISQKTELVVGLCFTNAALNHDVEFPPHVRFVHNWHAPGDIAVRFSSLIPAHPWGRMGAVGYDGPSPQVRNFNMARDFKGKEVTGHTAVYRNPDLRRFYLPLQIDYISEALDGMRLRGG